MHPGSTNRRLSKKGWGRHKERKRDPQISVLDTVLREAVIKQEIDALTTPTPAVHVQEPAETASQHTEADLLRKELDPQINSENRRLLSVLLYVQLLEDGITKAQALRQACRFYKSAESSLKRWVARWRGGVGIGDDVWGGHREYTLRRFALEAKARAWVQGHALIKGQPNMTAEAFAFWCNTELLVVDGMRVVD